MSKSYQPEEVPDLVRDALVKKFGESQRKRVKGYAKTQSLKELFKYLDPDDVIQLKARRTVRDDNASFSHLSLPSVGQYIDMEEQLSRQVVIDFDRLKHGAFKWASVESLIDKEDFEDMAVERVVYRFENHDLYDLLLGLLDESVDYSSGGSTFFNQPFHAELSTTAPGTDEAGDAVRSYNDPSLFTDLGFNVRTLDLDAIWSLDAWKGSGGGVMGKGTSQRQMEELAFNNVESDAPMYGAINSTVAVNEWRKSLNPGVTGAKEFEWTEDGEWEQVR